MGLTAYVAGKPWLVIAHDGKEYTLEDEKGETITLSKFVWDDEALNATNSLIAASRISTSPFRLGMVVDGTEIGKLSFDEGQRLWSVKTAEEEPLSLIRLIEQLEAAGWEMEGEPEEEEQKAPAQAKVAMGGGCPYCHEHEVKCDNCGHDFHLDEVDHFASVKEAEKDDRQSDESERKDEDNKGSVCPNCEGHTVTLENYDKETQSGTFHCKSCGHRFEHGVQGRGHTGATEKLADSDGNPLEGGRWYTLHGRDYKVPDTIKIISISPEGISAAASSDAQAIPIHISLEDIFNQGYSFEPLIVESRETTEAGFIETASLDKESRRKFSPSEQKALIEEKGTARNAGKLDLNNTHYRATENSEEDPVDLYFLW